MNGLKYDEDEDGDEDGEGCLVHNDSDSEEHVVDVDEGDPRPWNLVHCLDHQINSFLIGKETKEESQRE